MHMYTHAPPCCPTRTLAARVHVHVHTHTSLMPYQDFGRPAASDHSSAGSDAHSGELGFFIAVFWGGAAAITVLVLKS